MTIVSLTFGQQGSPRCVFGPSKVTTMCQNCQTTLFALDLWRCGAVLERTSMKQWWGQGGGGKEVFSKSLDLPSCWPVLTLCFSSLHGLSYAPISMSGIVLLWDYSFCLLTKGKPWCRESQDIRTKEWRVGRTGPVEWHRSRMAFSLLPY